MADTSWGNALVVLQPEWARAASRVEVSRMTTSLSRGLTRAATPAVTASRDKVARCLALMARCRRPV